MKLPYFKIKEAFSEVRESFSYGDGADKLASTAKLLGKSVANLGMIAVEIGVEAIKKSPETLGGTAKKHLDQNSDSMTEEQIEQAKKMIKKGNEARQCRLERD